MDTTFSMIKPDATARNLVGAIIQKLESEGLKLQAGRLTRITPSLCETFYQDHKSKPFFKSLINFMLSGPVFVMALKGEKAVEKVRKIMGHTDPAQARPGTIRALYGESIERNSIHGSDSLPNADRELALFFNKTEWKW
ncbi:MAG: nucleoside-diphosphate kinase [Bdellovibrionales bacterium]|nr:nucleoside-diphosphate kinase [Bdellovibrionales bacterium]